MYTFKEIACFENKDLVEAMKQYASERIAQKRGSNVDVKFSKADKLKKIDDAYMKEVAKNAKLLEDIMEKHGFKPYSSEWWHFSDKQSYDVGKDFKPNNPKT